MSVNLSGKELPPRSIMTAAQPQFAEERSWLSSVRWRLGQIFSRSSGSDSLNPIGPGDYQPGTSKKMIDAIDEFFAVLDQFVDEEEFIAPESEQIVREAFENFLKDSGLLLSELSFPILMEEKTGEHTYRDDGVTPNWYHELRESIMLLSLIRSGKLSEEMLAPHGGVDTALASILRHDSWEDFGKNPTRIKNALVEKINDYSSERMQEARQLWEAGLTNKDLNIEKISQDHKELIQKAQHVETIIDLISRKEPVLENGQPKRDSNGKIVTVARYNGDMNKYFSRQMENPIAVLVKYFDSIEGTSTRNGVYTQNKEKYSEARNTEYAQKISDLYRNVRPTDEEAIKRWPEFTGAIRSTDGMLGIALTLLETVNTYRRHPNYSPVPIRTRQYVDPALEAFWPAPLCARPDLMAIGRIEAMAKTSAKMRDVLEYAIYPSRGIKLALETVRTFYSAPEISDYTPT